MRIHDLAQQGKHNAYNSMASGIAARLLDIRKEIIRESLSDFQNVEHRLEFVAKVHGIEFINDSKATNVNSTWYALESMQKLQKVPGGLPLYLSGRVHLLTCNSTKKASQRACRTLFALVDVVEAGRVLKTSWK